MTLYFNLIK